MGGVSGCSSSSLDPSLIAQHRARLTLTEEPDNVMTVYEVRESLLGSHEADHDDGNAIDATATADSQSGEADQHTEPQAPEDAADEDHGVHEHDHHAEEITEATEKSAVAMVGQIGGLSNPWEETQPEYPFAEHQAVFFLADPQAIAEHEEAGHVHAPGEECAFCAAHAEENSELLAVIRVVDDSGQVLPVDVRQILDLKARDTVVVRGEAQVLPGGMMVVEATGVYVRR